MEPEEWYYPGENVKIPAPAKSDLDFYERAWAKLEHGDPAWIDNHGVVRTEPEYGLCGKLGFLRSKKKQYKPGRRRSSLRELFEAMTIEERAEVM